MNKSNAQFQKILVTGGAGFVGTHLCRRLVQDGYQVVTLDLKDPTVAIDGVEYVRGDVRDASLLRKLINTTDVVYHLAATVSIPACQKDPVESYSNNFNATLGVLEAIRAKAETTNTKPMPLVFASTAAVYGMKGDDGRALAEDDVAEEFLSYYAAQKHASEKTIELHSRFYAIPATVFRFFNIIGPGQDPSSPYSGVITIFMNLAKTGKPLLLNGGGHQTRDFISVYDIVDACVTALSLPTEQWNPKPINLGTGSVITIREVAELVRKINDNRSEILSAPSREGDVTHSRADVRRGFEALGWKAHRTVGDSLSEI